MGRRSAITTTSSGSAATTFHLWCGARLCQALSANGAPARSYYDEGEVDNASGTQLYYSPDRLGSVRDAAVVVGGASAAPQAYDYDAYGNPVQTMASGAPTDFRYADMFYHADSGLYLTQYRAYDPRTARWLSRDPVEEKTARASDRPDVSARAWPSILDNESNLYGYVGGNPVSFIDPLGLLLEPGEPPQFDPPDPSDFDCLLASDDDGPLGAGNGDAPLPEILRG